jgi:phage protein U
MNLATIGLCTFTLKTNLQSIRYQWQNAYAKHDVIGTAPVYEDMGIGEASIEISGVIKPRSLGVDGGFTMLLGASKSRIPLPFMLADLSAMGWVIVDVVKRDDEDLDPTSIGRSIEFKASLLRTGTPSGIGVITNILRLLS